MRYVDRGHPAAPIFVDGSVLRPYFDVLSGSNGMPASGGALSIVEGDYPVSGSLVLDRTLVLDAPCGTVAIGE